MKRKIYLFLVIYSSIITVWGLSNFNGGCWLSNVEVKGSLGYESEYVYRGAKTAQDVILPVIEIGYCLPCGKVYTGGWGVAPIGNSDFKAVRQFNPYIGAQFNLTDIFTADVGYTYYWYFFEGSSDFQFLRHNLNRQNEIYLGIIGDVILCPALYVFYNYNLDQWLIQANVKHSFDLFCLTSVCGLYLDFYADAAWLKASRFNGDERPGGIQAHHNSYWYFDVKFDLTYRFNECVWVSVGPRLAYNTDGITPSNFLITEGYTANALGNHHHLLWWGGRVGFKF